MTDLIIRMAITIMCLCGIASLGALALLLAEMFGGDEP